MKKETSGGLVFLFFGCGIEDYLATALDVAWVITHVLRLI